MMSFEEILTECIDDIKAGRATVEDCLARHQSLADELEPLLRIGLGIGEPPAVRPSSAFKMKTRVWLMEQIHEMQTARWPSSRHRSALNRTPLRRRFGTIGIVAAIVLTFAALGGTVYAAQDSLPGDTLYPVKAAAEQVLMRFVRNDVARAERGLSFADRRVEEIVDLAKQGRVQDLDLAVDRYDRALGVILDRMEDASRKGLSTAGVSETVAEAMAEHRSVLDTVSDIAPDEGRSATARARYVLATGWENALLALARDNPEKATEMNLAAMSGRLHRARAMAERGNIREVEEVVQQFEAMARLSEEIVQVIAEAGMDLERVEELIADVTPNHVEVLAQVWQIVPEQVQQVVEGAMTNAIISHQERVRALEQSGIEAAPLRGIAPMQLWERVEARVREQGAGMPDQTKPPQWTPGVPSAGHAGGGCPSCRRP